QHPNGEHHEVDVDEGHRAGEPSDRRGHPQLEVGGVLLGVGQHRRVMRLLRIEAAGRGERHGSSSGCGWGKCRTAAYGTFRVVLPSPAVSTAKVGQVGKGRPGVNQASLVLAMVALARRTARTGPSGSTSARNS